jgi:hypothetical protein
MAGLHLKIIPVVTISSISRVGAVVDEPIHAGSSEDVGQVVDLRRLRRVPAKVNSALCAMAKQGCTGNDEVELMIEMHGDTVLDGDLDNKNDS